MKIASYFTTPPDPEISADGQRDPMGMQVIWSHFGEKIFGNRISSIANDIRLYSFNLFNHYLIRDLTLNAKIRLSSSMKERYESPESQKLKKGLIVFIENLFIFSTLSHSGFKKSGILGIQNGKARYEKNNGNPILNVDENDGVLKRQLGLGVNGRYKTPFMELGLLKGNYEYPSPFEGEIWKETEGLFQKWEEAQNLKKGLEEIILPYFRSRKKNKKIEFKSLVSSGLPEVVSKMFWDSSSLFEVFQKILD